LYDVVDGPDGNDASIRPNQIFAASLSHSPLSTADQANVVRVCRRQLLTAFGLRSLAPGSVAYHPHYGGGVLERDGGYQAGCSDRSVSPLIGSRAMRVRRSPSCRGLATLWKIKVWER
jgi:glycogen debranching enzyme